MCAGERAALDELHAEERLSLALADFVDGHDVRMVQAGHRLGLRAEPLHEIRRRELSRRQSPSPPRSGSAGSGAPCKRCPCRPAPLLRSIRSRQRRRGRSAWPTVDSGGAIQRPAVEHRREKTLRAKPPGRSPGAARVRTSGKPTVAGQFWHQCLLSIQVKKQIRRKPFADFLSA